MSATKPTRSKINQTVPPNRAAEETPLERLPVPITAQTKVGKISFWSQVWYLFKLREWVWSFPLFSFVFYYSGIVIHYLFGYEWGFYDPSLLQPIFGALAIVLIALNGIVFILFFYFKGMYRYWFGKYKRDEGVVINYSKHDFINLEGWQRLVITLFTVCFFVYLVVRVYLAIK